MKENEIRFWPEMKRILSEMEAEEPASDTYKALMARLNEIVHIDVTMGTHQRKLGYTSEPWYDKILNNAPLVTGIGTLIGIIWITKDERINVITSRAFGFLKFK